MVEFSDRHSAAADVAADCCCFFSALLALPRFRCSLFVGNFIMYTYKRIYQFYAIDNGHSI